MSSDQAEIDEPLLPSAVAALSRRAASGPDFGTRLQPQVDQHSGGRALEERLSRRKFSFNLFTNLRHSD